ncbi:hypothetical protein C6P45_005111 [Maudiozyma exigua]|uniref:Kinetochore-associated protein MTW1 n=1 Tax=Maudiozyma exigua TaxID=34358 RepID=A0A9P7BB87_MAUEX|nr:hypothetical protein C6P45_005111 [Kazachstania exigua]
MSAPNLQSTAILTEHLEYPPISLLDDIINNVNDIMYKCTAAMEKYLLRKSDIEGHDYSEEIRVGIAKLETLLEHTVDKNFDKLELYVLRNVLTIPSELLENNVFLLKHQQNLDTQWVMDPKNQDKDNDILTKKMIEIETKLTKNQLIRDKIKQIKLLKKEIENFKIFIERNIKQLLEIESMENGIPLKEMFQSLRPIDESMRLLTSQLKQLYNDSEEYCSNEMVQSITKQKDNNNNVIMSRAKYIDRATSTLLNPSESIPYHSNTNIQIQIRDPDLSLFNDI